MLIEINSKKELKQRLKKSKLYKIVVYYRLLKKKYFEFIYPLTLKQALINRKKPSCVSISATPLLNGKNVYVSLTTFPDRIRYVYKTIYSLMNQDIKPNGILLWLSTLQFPNKERDLPKELLELKPLGLTINWVNEDYRSYKKLIYALESYPDSFLVTADDDLYYPTYWLNRLISSYDECPNAVHCHLTTEMTISDDNTIQFKDRYGTSGDGSLSFMNKILGGSGTLYPPHSLYKDTTRSDYFMELAPTNDDIWFWAMAVMNGYKIRWIPNGMKTLYYVEGSQENSPCLVNINNHGEKLRSLQMNAVITKYNLYRKIIDNECN